MPLSHRQPDTYQTIGRLHAGDLLMGRVVVEVKEGGRGASHLFRTIVFDDGSQIVGHVGDRVELDTDAQRTVRFEPVLERDGTRYGWRMCMFIDPDWMDFSLVGGSAYTVEFRVELTDDQLVGLANAAVAAGHVTSMDDKSAP